MLFFFQKPWSKETNWPPEAGEMYFLIGMCYMESRDYLGAQDAFNNAIRVDPKQADVSTKQLLQIPDLYNHFAYS